jgi:hypothetical protein
MNISFHVTPYDVTNINGSHSTSSLAIVQGTQLKKGMEVSELCSQSPLTKTIMQDFL